MEWTFHANTLNNAVYWAWMITGFLSAVASVVCMVNMAGYLQLAYLAALVISSGSEILTTQVARQIQNRHLDYGEPKAITDSQRWSKAVVRSVLAVEDRWPLADLPWIEFGLFPDTPVFQNLCSSLRALKNTPRVPEKPDVLTELTRNIAEPDQLNLTERMASEILDACQERNEVK